jgi:hypothetical protein
VAVLEFATRRREVYGERIRLGENITSCDEAVPRGRGNLRKHPPPTIHFRPVERNLALRKQDDEEDVDGVKFAKGDVLVGIHKPSDDEEEGASTGVITETVKSNAVKSKHQAKAKGVKSVTESGGKRVNGKGGKVVAKPAEKEGQQKRTSKRERNDCLDAKDVGVPQSIGNVELELNDLVDSDDLADELYLPRHIGKKFQSP